MAERVIAPLTGHHRGIHDFAGEWRVSQRLFTSPNSEPIISVGKSVCRVMVGGRAVLTESEFEGGYSSVVIATWNLSKGVYEGFHLDIYSFDGFDPLTGNSLRPAALAPGADIDLSDAALLAKAKPTRERLWNGRITVPHRASLVEGGDRLLAGVNPIPVQVSENRVSDNKWVLACISSDSADNPFVMLENTYTRV